MTGKASRAFDLHRSAIRQVVEAHSGRNPRVFGSVVRGSWRGYGCERPGPVDRHDRDHQPVQCRGDGTGPGTSVGDFGSCDDVGRPAWRDPGTGAVRG
jgi:hypothetical protein